MPMANGVCYYHGGRTPKGKDWHKPRWPKKTAPDAERKMVARLRDLERAEKQRQKRLAKMSAEERAAFDKWHRERPTGTPAQRAAKKRARQQNEEARAIFAQAQKPRPMSAEVAALQAQIEELEALRAALGAAAFDPAEPGLDKSAPERPRPDDDLNPEQWSIFG